jgi:hypothetical protein
VHVGNHVPFDGEGVSAGPWDFTGAEVGGRNSRMSRRLFKFFRYLLQSLGLIFEA